MTDIEICNLALGWLGVAPIVGFDDESNEARLCSQNYPMCRDAVLEDRKWSFAKRQYVLESPLATAPLFKWARAFALASEVLRVHGVDDGSGAWDVDHEKSGRSIFTNAEKLWVEAVVQVEDTSLFSPNFCQALAARIASDLAVPLSGNRQLQADLLTIYKQKLADAAGTDGSQGKKEQSKPSRLAQRRY